MVIKVLLLLMMVTVYCSGATTRSAKQTTSVKQRAKPWEGDDEGESSQSESESEGATQGEVPKRNTRSRLR